MSTPILRADVDQLVDELREILENLERTKRYGDTQDRWGAPICRLHMGSANSGYQTQLYIYENKSVKLGFTKRDAFIRLTAMLQGLRLGTGLGI